MLEQHLADQLVIEIEVVRVRDRQVVDGCIHYQFAVRHLPARPETAFRATGKHRTQCAPAFECLAGERLEVIAAGRVQGVRASLDQQDAVTGVGNRRGECGARNPAADDGQVAVIISHRDQPL